VDYLVRLVEKGDRYGRNFCRTHMEDRPTVEFYDYESRAEAYDFVGEREDAIAAGAARLGQYVSSYYVFTLLENIATTGGIDLCGHVPKWVIDGDALRRAFVDLELWQPAAPEFLPEIEVCDEATKLVVVYDSEDPDTEPSVWLPQSQAHRFTLIPLNKSQELGGRYPNTDPADIALLEAGTNAAYPRYVKIN
jgi:hypothetical protein